MWRRKTDGFYYQQINGRQFRLGRTKREAEQRLTELLYDPPTGEKTQDVIDAFLNWSEKNNAPATYKLEVDTQYRRAMCPAGLQLGCGTRGSKGNPVQRYEGTAGDPARRDHHR